MSTIDEASAARLADTPLAWLTTVRKDGQPQTSYIWFHFDGDDIIVMSQPGKAKVRNVVANPRVSFNLDGDGSGGHVLTLDGTAEILEAGLAPDRRAAYLAKYEDRIRNDLGSTPDGFLADYSVPIRVVPARLRAW